MSISKHSYIDPDLRSSSTVSPRGVRNRILIMAALSFAIVSANSALATETHDPLISVNKSEHGFNKAADTVVFKALARLLLTGA